MSSAQQNVNPSSIDSRKRKLFDSLEKRAPDLPLKKNLTLSDTQKLLTSVARGGEIDPKFVKKRKTKRMIGLIEIDALSKVVVHGRAITDILNADEFAAQVTGVPEEVSNWNTAHLQTIINTVAGRGQVNASPTGNTSNQNIVRRIQGQIRSLVVAHREILKPIFDPVYVHCDFSHGGADNLRGPPNQWMDFITRIQTPAAPAAPAGQPVWPVWMTAPPASVKSSNGLFVFDQGLISTRFFNLNQAPTRNSSKTRIPFKDSFEASSAMLLQSASLLPMC